MPNHYNEHLWYCAICSQIKPIVIENIFNLIHNFSIPLKEDANFQKYIKWAEITSSKKIRQIALFSIEIDVKPNLTNALIQNSTANINSNLISELEQGEVLSDSDISPEAENTNNNYKTDDTSEFNHIINYNFIKNFSETLVALNADGLDYRKIRKNNVKQLVNHPLILPLIKPVDGCLGMDLILHNLHHAIQYQDELLKRTEKPRKLHHTPFNYINHFAIRNVLTQISSSSSTTSISLNSESSDSNSSEDNLISKNAKLARKTSPSKKTRTVLNGHHIITENDALLVKNDFDTLKQRLQDNSDTYFHLPLPCTAHLDTFPRVSLVATKKLLKRDCFTLPLTPDKSAKNLPSNQKHNNKEVEQNGDVIMIEVASDDNKSQTESNLLHNHDLNGMDKGKRVKGYDFVYSSLGYPPLKKTPVANKTSENAISQNLIPAQEQPYLLALDCEMCQLMDGSSALIRVSIVDESLTCIYDTLVKPPFNQVKDYLTQWSGLTEFDLIDVTVTLQDVQKDIQHIINVLHHSGTTTSKNGKKYGTRPVILCGHSLNFDLDALKMFHPYVIDTSQIYNLTGDTQYRKSKLKTLARCFLGREIQTASTMPHISLNKIGHDSIEDARTVMELVLLKLRSGQSYFGEIAASLKHSAALTISTFTKEQKMQNNRKNNTKHNNENVCNDINLKEAETTDINTELYCRECIPHVYSILENDESIKLWEKYDDNTLLDTIDNINDKNNNIINDKINTQSKQSANVDVGLNIKPCARIVPRNQDKTWLILTQSLRSHHTSTDSMIDEGSKKKSKISTNFTIKAANSYKSKTERPGASTLIPFYDVEALLEYQNIHVLDKFATFSNFRIPIEFTCETRQKIDNKLAEIINALPSNTLIVMLTWLNPLHNNDDNGCHLNTIPISNERSINPYDIGALWMKIKR